MTAGLARRWNGRLGAVLIVALCLGWVLYLQHRRRQDLTSVQPEAARAGTTIPPEYFGLTINWIGQQTPWPDFPLPGVRLWGAIYWAQINPAPGVYNWAKFDVMVDEALRHHADVIFNLAFTPRWAASVKDAEPFYSRGASSPPADIKSWEDFIGAAVKHAAGRVKYWEIWNEPEDPKYYSGDIASMVRMQQRAFEIIKAIDPSLMVLTPSCNGSTEGLRWLSAFLAAGGGRYADIMSFHGYWNDPHAEPIVGIVRRFKDLFTANGLGEKPLWDTEAGWPSTMMDEDLQAGFIARSYLMRWEFGVDRFYWYAYEGGGGNFGKLWDPKRGLLKPGVAYRTVQHWLVGSVVSRMLQRDGAVWTVPLRLGDGRSAIAVWDEDVRSTFSAPPDYDRYQTLDGREIPVNGAIEIGPQPILLIASNQGVGKR